MKPNLNPLTILVTRPSPQGETLCQLMKAAGENPIHFPTIEIQPIPFSIKGHYDWLIFTSPQAVYHSIATLQPIQSSLAAIGPGTAAVLQQYQLNPITYPETDSNSEGLLALPAFQNVKNQAIALIKGEGGRDLLAKELTARGAIVTPLIAYRRTLPENPFIPTAKIDMIIATSNNIIENLKELLGEKVLAIPIIVVSERMRVFAKKSGFKQIFLAKTASHDAIMACSLLVKESICQMKRK
jgi:uroporphyrinogen-III synthase